MFVEISHVNSSRTFDRIYEKALSAQSIPLKLSVVVTAG